MSAAASQLQPEGSVFLANTAGWFDAVATGLADRSLSPYLGAGLAALSPGVGVPTSYEGLADFLGKHVALPKRARGNPWASAQYIESRQHRSNVTRLMSTAFAAPVAPLAFQRYLASLELPLIVDTWYDGALRSAFEGRTDWIEIQGIDRAKIGEASWFRAYSPAGERVEMVAAGAAPTVVYKPHGGVTPSGNFLIADSDYVEVLTEIDIQTPIPETVRARRTGLGFVFLGCRFHDQLLRTYARQIVKRSRGPHYAVFDSDGVTRMERRFVHELGLRAIVCPLGSALDRLSAKVP